MAHTAMMTWEMDSLYGGRSRGAEEQSVWGRESGKVSKSRTHDQID